MARTSPVLRAGTAIYFPPLVGTVAKLSLLLAALIVTWTGLRLPGLGDPADLLLVMSFGLCGVMVVFGDLRFSPRAWIFVPVVAVIACVLAREVDPPPFYLQVMRFQILGYRPDSLLKALFWLFALLVVPLTIVACTVIDRRMATWTMAAYATGASVSSVVAMVDLTGATNIGRNLPGNLTTALINNTVDSSNRMPGLTDHPNSLGFTAVVSIPIVVYLMGTMRRRWIATIMLIALLGGVLASGSRGAQVVAPLAVLVSFLWSATKRPSMRFISISALAVIVAGLVAVFTLPAHIRESVLRITSLTSIVSAGNASDTGRLTLLGDALFDWRLYPIFGGGIRHIVEAHNIFVQLLASGGLVLFGAMVVYWLAMMRDCVLLSRLGFGYPRFLMVSIGAWLVLGLVENQLTERGVYFTVGCIAALASVHLVHQRADEESAGLVDPAPSGVDSRL
jgi:hypothetical protein